MKKVFLFLILSIITCTVFAQEEFNGKKYLLPDILKSEGCLPLDVQDSIVNTGYPLFAFSDLGDRCIVNNYAQMFFFMWNHMKSLPWFI